jgi:succinate dehydrogenase / fumarate reductase cytochrome b subunit
MRELLRILRSSLLMKAIMAVTGLIMLAFVTFHLTNNVRLYYGQDFYNRYGFAWKTPLVIHTVRPILIVSLGVHIAAGVILMVLNWRSRNVSYTRHDYQSASLFSRGMIFTGAVVGAYIAYHVLHAKVGITHQDLHARVDAEGRKDVYNLIVYSFQQSPVALAYLVGLACLCAHLSHGIQSACSTLGLTYKSNNQFWRWTGRVVAVALFLGYASIPVAVWLGVIQPAD